jgi:hypothetical protein
MTGEELAAWVERTRARRGLGPTITDEPTLRRIAVLAFAGSDDTAEPPARRKKGDGGRAPSP